MGDYPDAADGAQGWRADPFGLHEARYFSDGRPTKLVRDGTTDSYDEPPADGFPETTAVAAQGQMLPRRVSGPSRASFCPACGTRAVAGDVFCRQCGLALPALASPLAPDATAATPDLAAPEAAPGAPIGSAGSGPVASGLRYEPYPTMPPTGFAAPAPYGAYAGPSWPGTAGVALGPLSAFGAPLARWWQRVGAMVLDGLILGIPTGVLNAVLNADFGVPHTVVLANGIETVRSLRGGTRVLVFVAVLLAQGIYFAVLNGTRSGQTPGNRAPGIAVRDAITGEPIGFGRGLLRWFIRIILYVALVIPGIVNDLFPIWDSRRQSIADKAARSVVIRLK